MRIDIHSHTAPAKYVEAIRRDPKSMGCRIEKDDQGAESIVQDIGRSTRLRPGLIDPERRLRQVAAEQIDVIVESLLPPLLPLWAPTAIAVRVCQIVNNAIAEDAVRFPGRMVAMGILPLQERRRGDPGAGSSREATPHAVCTHSRQRAWKELRRAGVFSVFRARPGTKRADLYPPA